MKLLRCAALALALALALAGCTQPAAPESTVREVVTRVLTVPNEPIEAALAQAEDPDALQEAYTELLGDWVASPSLEDAGSLLSWLQAVISQAGRAGLSIAVEQVDAVLDSEGEGYASYRFTADATVTGEDGTAHHEAFCQVLF